VSYSVSDTNFRQEHLVATAMHSALVLQPHWISSLLQVSLRHHFGPMKAVSP